MLVQAVLLLAVQAFTSLLDATSIKWRFQWKILCLTKERRISSFPCKQRSCMHRWSTVVLIVRKSKVWLLLKQIVDDGCLVLGTTDSYGHLFVSRLVPNGQDRNGLTYSVLPRDGGVGEGSWTGLCFSPGQVSMAAIARNFCKSVDVYDQDIHVRSLHTLLYPSSLSFLQDSFLGDENLIAVAEGCQVSIWDLRTKENGGCVQRICGSMGDIIYAVCSSSSWNIAVGGADRTATIYDCRRWSAMSRWVNCSRYEITGLAFSSYDSNYVYVQGVDYEIFCGNWKDTEKTFSFRGDSNWLGFSKCSNRDVLAGWCDSGSIFVADIGNRG